MKMQTLYDLLESAQDVCDLFDEVQNPAQLVSRLERLKRGDVESVLEDVDALRAATSAVLEDNLELGGALGGGELPDDLQSELEEFSRDLDVPTAAEGNDNPAAAPSEPEASQEKADT